MSICKREGREMGEASGTSRGHGGVQQSQACSAMSDRREHVGRVSLKPVDKVFTLYQQI